MPAEQNVTAEVFVLMKIRIKFQKSGVMKFVGHLDMMRYFQRAIRRSHIDVCYSEGFSPHQIMSFASPLGVGITSDGEYLDIEVNSSMSTEEAINALNSTMVEGVRIFSYKKLPDNAKTSMAIIAGGEYILSYKDGYQSPYSLTEWEEILDKEFFSKDSFMIMKKTKKSEREVDLKPLVFDFSVKEENQSPVFHLFVSTGSIDNLKPELVLSSIYEKLGKDYDPMAIQIHRVDLFTKNDDGRFLSLGEMGEDIL